MPSVDGGAPSLVGAVAARTAELTGALRCLDDGQLLAPSSLEGWSRLTIACHLRYGAEAFRRMTGEAMAGRRTSYYPRGRQLERTATLRPAPGESPAEVVGSLVDLSGALQRAWESMADRDWELMVDEPEDNPDLGSLPLQRLPLMRLTEVEVHGGDLDLGLEDWSECFVRAALPFRLDRLDLRRVADLPDGPVERAWLLVATDGPVRMVTVRGGSVSSVAAAADDPAAAVIEGSSRDILALLLGRPTAVPLTVSGDRSFGRAFSRALPGP